MGDRGSDPSRSIRRLVAAAVVAGGALAAGTVGPTLVFGHDRGDGARAQDRSGDVTNAQAAPTPSPTPSPSPSPSPTPSPTPSPSASPTPSPSPSPSPTPTPGPSPPRLAARVAPVQSLSRQNGALRVIVVCGKPCRLVARGIVTVPNAAAVFPLKPVVRTLRASRPGVVRLRLSPRARRAIARRASRRRPAIARLRLAAASRGSRPRAVSRRITVIP